MQKVNSRDDAKSVSSKHRRAIKKSIDLQDYLNYQTGLDYKKLNPVSMRQPINKTESVRKDSDPSPAIESSSLMDKISKNKYITEKDVERDKEE
jgi:hypothetical protein